jgi:hypothetical protein
MSNISAADLVFDCGIALRNLTFPRWLCRARGTAGSLEHYE